VDQPSPARCATCRRLMQVLVEPQQKETEHRRARQAEPSRRWHPREISAVACCCGCRRPRQVLLVQSQRHFAMNDLQRARQTLANAIPVRTPGDDSMISWKAWRNAATSSPCSVQVNCARFYADPGSSSRAEHAHLGGESGVDVFDLVGIGQQSIERCAVDARPGGNRRNACRRRVGSAVPESSRGVPDTDSPAFDRSPPRRAFFEPPAHVERSPATHAAISSC